MSDEPLDDPARSKLRILDTNTDKQARELAASLERMKRATDDYCELIKVIAKNRRFAFNAYIKEGFTPEQALELVKHGP